MRYTWTGKRNVLTTHSTAEQCLRTQSQIFVHIRCHFGALQYEQEMHACTSLITEEEGSELGREAQIDK